MLSTLINLNPSKTLPPKLSHNNGTLTMMIDWNFWNCPDSLLVTRDRNCLFAIELWLVDQLSLPVFLYTTPVLTCATTTICHYAALESELLPISPPFLLVSFHSGIPFTVTLFPLLVVILSNLVYLYSAYKTFKSSSVFVFVFFDLPLCVCFFPNQYSNVLPVTFVLFCLCTG